MAYTFASATVLLLIPLLAERIQRLLGQRFVVLMERLMGLILVAVAVEMLVPAIQSLI